MLSSCNHIILFVSVLFAALTGCGRSKKNVVRPKGGQSISTHVEGPSRSSNSDIITSNFNQNNNFEDNLLYNLHFYPESFEFGPLNVGESERKEIRIEIDDKRLNGYTFDLVLSGHTFFFNVPTALNSCHGLVINGPTICNFVLEAKAKEYNPGMLQIGLLLKIKGEFPNIVIPYFYLKTMEPSNSISSISTPIPTPTPVSSDIEQKMQVEVNPNFFQTTLFYEQEDSIEVEFAWFDQILSVEKLRIDFNGDPRVFEIEKDNCSGKSLDEHNGRCKIKVRLIGYEIGQFQNQFQFFIGDRSIEVLQHDFIVKVTPPYNVIDREKDLGLKLEKRNYLNCNDLKEESDKFRCFDFAHILMGKTDKVDCEVYKENELKEQCQKFLKHFDLKRGNEENRLSRRINQGLTKSCSKGDLNCKEWEKVFHFKANCDHINENIRPECFGFRSLYIYGTPLFFIEKLVGLFEGNRLVHIDETSIKRQRESIYYLPHQSRLELQSKGPEFVDQVLRIRSLYPYLIDSYLLFSNKGLRSKRDVDYIGENEVKVKQSAYKIYEGLEKFQRIGFELEVPFIELEMDKVRDDIILKSIFGTNDWRYRQNSANPLIWHMDLYRMSALESQTMVELPSGEKANSIIVQLESRYSKKKNSYIEIVTAPLLNYDEDSDSSHLNRSNSVSYLNSMISAVCSHEQGKVKTGEWSDLLSKIDIEGTDQSLQYHNILKTNNAEKGLEENLNYVVDSPSDKIEDRKQKEIKLFRQLKDEKISLDRNDFVCHEEYREKYKGKITSKDLNLSKAHVQSNVDVLLNQFFTNPFLVQSIGKDEAHLDGELYQVAWTLTKLIKTEYIKANHKKDAIVKLNEDYRNYASGIVTFLLYQSLQHSLLSELGAPINKWTLSSQAIKTFLTDLPRIEGLTITEKETILAYLKIFTQSGKSDLIYWIGDKLLKNLKFINKYSEKKVGKSKAWRNYKIKEDDYFTAQVIESVLLKTQSMIKDYFLMKHVSIPIGQYYRYSDESYDKLGNIISYGTIINKKSKEGAFKQTGSLINPFVIKDENRNHLAIVLETRFPWALINLAEFWEKKNWYEEYRKSKMD